MEIDKLRQELNDLLENIVEHSENYSKNRPIPSLEVSYVLSKVNKMQETLIVLKYLLKEEEINSKRKRDNYNSGHSSEEVIAAPAKEEVQVKQEVQATITPEAEPEESNKPSLEKLPIAKLVDAFTLNDRYLYANELFEKDMTAFNDCVKLLDACNTKEEADSQLAKIVAESDWDQENVHVLSFHELVERRFL